MVEKKRPGETFESLAERLIREAQERGEFANLPGFGQPIPDIDAPPDENWWVKDKLRREQQNCLPPILQARLEVERAMESLSALASEAEVRTLVRKLNDKIRAAHFSHLAGPSSGVAPLNEADVVVRWREVRQSNQQSDSF